MSRLSMGMKKSGEGKRLLLAGIVRTGKVGVVAASCCGEDRRGRRSIEMGGVPLASVYLCGFSGLLPKKKGGKGGGLFFFF